MNLIKLGLQVGVVIFVAECTSAFLSGCAMGIMNSIKKHSKKSSESDKVTNIRRDKHE